MVGCSILNYPYFLGGPISNSLLQVDLSYLHNDECKQHYPVNEFLPRGLLESQLCALDHKKEKTQDTCQVSYLYYFLKISFIVVLMNGLQYLYFVLRREIPVDLYWL